MQGFFNNFVIVMMMQYFDLYFNSPERHEAYFLQNPVLIHDQIIEASFNRKTWLSHLNFI